MVPFSILLIEAEVVTIACRVAVFAVTTPLAETVATEVFFDLYVT